MIHIAWVIFQIIVGYNLILPFILFLFSLRKKKKNYLIPPDGGADYAVIVTAYEQVDLLESAIKSILNLNYSNYHIYVVADKCDISLLKIDHPRLSILRPKHTLASNTKSHFYAIDRFIRAHDRLTIVDSDNLVHPELLNEMNHFFAQGFVAVQGKREPKNLENDLARLDAARDCYYDFFDGAVLFKLGSSSTLSGSGMAFTTEVYKQCLANVNIDGAGFDKVLQAALIKKGYRIAHAPHAIVYDQKSSQGRQLVSQRARWINTWFKYAKYGIEITLSGLLNKNRNQILFGLILLRPPLFMFLTASVICLAINLVAYPVGAIIWMAAICFFVLGFNIALRLQGAKSEIYQALKSVPRFIFYQMIALSRTKSANRKSVATKHLSPVTNSSRR